MKKIETADFNRKFPPKIKRINPDNNKVKVFKSIFKICKDNTWIVYCVNMKRLFKILAYLNKLMLPSLTKRRLDPVKASKLQLALIGWRYYITKNSL